MTAGVFFFWSYFVMWDQFWAKLLFSPACLPFISLSFIKLAQQESADGPARSSRTANERPSNMAASQRRPPLLRVHQREPTEARVCVLHCVCPSSVRGTVFNDTCLHMLILIQRVMKEVCWSLVHCAGLSFLIPSVSSWMKLLQLSPFLTQQTIKAL